MSKSSDKREKAQREAKCAGKKCLKCGEQSDYHECVHSELYPDEKLPTVIVTTHGDCGIWATYDGQSAREMDPKMIPAMPPWLAYFLGRLTMKLTTERLISSMKLPMSAPLSEAPRWVMERVASMALNALAEPEKPEPKKLGPC